MGAAPINPSAPIALPGAKHSLSSCPLSIGIYICTHMCSGLAAALPSDAQGWGQGAITLCQPLTNTCTWHKTHTPSAALSLCHSVRSGAEWVSGGSEMGHWGSLVSDRLGKGRWLPSPRLGSSPSLQPAPSQHLPAGCDGGLAVLGTAVTQPAGPGREGRVFHCSHSTPSPGPGQRLLCGHSYGLYTARGFCHGAGSGRRGLGEAKGL